MKQLISAFLFLGFFALTIGLISSCKDEIAFPDPGFDSTADREVDVRRDTADTYTISLDMDVPNGVQYINILNGRNYALIEEVTSYNGQTGFTFKYDIDITPFDTDTTLTYIVKVVDNDNRTTNKGFIINVLPFSAPEIILAGGTNVALIAPVYNLKGLITTGMLAIDTVEVYFEDNLAFGYYPDSVVTEYTLNTLVGIGELEEDTEYTISILIADVSGQRRIFTVTVIRGQIFYPTKITSHTTFLDITDEIYLFYDDQNRIDSFTINKNMNDRLRCCKLVYNELGMVTHFNESSYEDNQDPIFTTNRYSRFYYEEGTTRLTEVGYHVDRIYDNGLEEIEDEVIYMQSFQYREDGTVKSFVGDLLVDDVTYTEGYAEGEMIFAEFWDLNECFEITTKMRRTRADFDPVFMPTYIEGLPPFYPGSGVYQAIYNDLFYHAYLFTGTNITDPENYPFSVEDAYSYILDAQGALTQLTRSYQRNGIDAIMNYYFEY